MRMMMTFKLPVEKGNQAFKDGSLVKVMESLMGKLKPEAAYFGEREGKRGCVLILDVASAADVPRIAEPFFLSFNAEVEFRVCMLPEDLAKANLEELGKKWG